MKTKIEDIDLSNESREYWEKILNYPMSRGSLGEPTQRDAVLEYLERHNTLVVPSTDLPDGFSTSDELAEQYLKEK